RLDLAPDAVTDSYELREPFRIVVDIQRGAPASGLPPASGGAGRGITLRPSEPKATPSIEIIVIDPGHGGDETGALGVRGGAEKDLTLELARALRDRLRARLPVRVALTRDEDSTLSLTARSATANQYRADLFVSIHLNSSLGATAHGAETYFLSIDASDERAASSAAAENAAPAGGGDADELELLLWDLAQSRHLARSQRVAMLIQQELNQTLGLRDRGVKQAPFRVLMGANMPAVLVELGFLSNPDEEAKLKDPGYRAELVDALVRAIGRYRSELQPQLGDPAEAAASPSAMPAPTPTPTPTPKPRDLG
ncbi:MAG TPA: N-acetylmuramoyl-L-alanine amidase, partial [Kofleriaceae bacterium]